MSYLRLLDEAHQQLERGELLAAEDLVRRAREAWARSRFRAPVVEKGIEPVLRRAGKWLGRRSDSPVLPVFGHRVARLEEDLAALGRLLREEALDLARRRDESQGQRELELLERALRLDRMSRVFTLDGVQRWTLTRSYLQVGRRLARAPRSDLLPAEVATVEDLVWLGEWAEAWLAGGALGDAATLDWVVRQASAAAALAVEGSGEDSRWWWIAARAALRDPLDGPRALLATRRALETGGLAAESHERALRSLAGLLVNERVLAGPGADAMARLRRHASLAGQDAWPGAEIERLLNARRQAAGSTTLVAASWSDGGPELVLVAHQGGRACDALVMRLGERPDDGDPYAATLAEARGWIHRWLPDDVVLVLPGAPPAHVEAVLGDTPRLRVDRVGAALAPSLRTDRAPDASDGEALAEFGGEFGGEPALPALSHPLWAAGPVPEPWSTLALRARRTIPALSHALAAAPAFASPWGRANLRALAAYGLSTCGALDLAANALLGDPDPEPVDLQTVLVGVELRWPRLEARAWRVPPKAEEEEPERTDERDAPSPPEAGSDVWVGHHGSPGELAAVAATHRRSEVLTAGPERADAIATESARRVDPRAVSVAPPRARCAEPWLALLESWIGEAVADPDRQLDVLWLLRSLSETATGDPRLDLRSERGLPLRAEVEEVARRDHRCAAACRLSREGGCWPAQLAGRRERAAVWVVDLESSFDALDGLECVLLDDPRSWVVRGSAPVAEARLEHALRRVGAAERAWIWMKAGPLGDATLEAWRSRAENPRPLHRRPAAALRASAELWTAPPGYRLADPLLGQEAHRLLALRAEALRRESPDAVWWRPEDGPRVVDDAPSVRGVAVQPRCEEVLCGALGDPEPMSDLLLLLRAGAVLSHATARAVILDPRLAHLLGHPGGRWGEGTLAAHERFAEALGPGARLLGAKAAQPGPHWTHPLTAARMATVRGGAAPVGPEDEFRTDALARALRESSRGQVLVLDAAPDRGRRLVIDTVRALAESSGDGGPLGVRCVVVVGAPRSWRDDDARARVLTEPDDRTLGTVVLEVERGSVTRVDVAPSLLDDEGLLAWARRVSGVAWCFVRGERDLGSDPLRSGRAMAGEGVTVARAKRWSEAIERASSRALVFVDRGGGEEVARALGARLIGVEGSPEIGDWILSSRPFESVEIACPHCEATMVVADPHARCPACERRAWMRARGRARVWSAVEDALVQRLRREADARTWWALAARPERVRHLRERLGLQPWSHDEAPLWAGASGASNDGTTAIFSAADLWEQDGPVPAVFHVGLLDDAHRLHALLARLDALGAHDRTLELLLGPVGIDAAESAPFGGGRWRWTVARTEIEFRLRSRLRARGAAPGSGRVGLGPGSGVPRLEDEASDVLDALLGVSRSAEAIEAALATALGELERSGLRFGRTDAIALAEPVARAHAGVLRWARTEGLLYHDQDGRGEAPEAARPSDPVHALRWERALRGATGHGVRVASLPTTDLVAYRETEAAPSLSSSRRVGIAGSGKSRWLCDRVEHARRAGQRVLVIVPSATARGRWARAGTLALDVATPEEIALAFLGAARVEATGGAPRLLPASGRGDGEEIRLRLMRETSRRYASIAGGVPAVDAADLRRIVEDQHAEPLPDATDTLDPALLSRCAAEARAAAGWLSTRELRARSRRWIERERDGELDWSARYPYVALDDAQDVHPEHLAFLRELLQGAVWWETADPLLGPVPAPREHEHEPDVDLQSHVLPREWIAAIEVLWRGAPALPGRPRTTRKGRDARRLQSVRVLTLEAAHDWIVAEIDPTRPPDRTAVVVAHENDRTWLAQALRASRLEVRIAERLARWTAPGPRELLACLHLVLDPEADPTLRERLLAVVLGPAFEANDGAATVLLAGLVPDPAAGDGVTQPLDGESARVAVLAALAPRLRPDTAVRDALELLLRGGALDPLLAGDAAVGRLQEILEHEAALRVDDLIDSVGAEIIAYPAGRSRAIWILGPDDLGSERFEHVIHVCTGFEPPARHYRALAAASERFTLLHSERDPLR